MNYNNRQLLYFLPDDNWWVSLQGGFLALVASERDLIRLESVSEVKVGCWEPRMLMIGDEPALLTGVKEGACFTCYRYFVKAGPAHLPSMEALESLRHATDNVEGGELGVIQKALPLINILAKGMYHFKLENYYPTDGKGNFFWMPLNRQRVYDCATYSHIYSGPARFLAPTQPVTAFNPARVEEYRRRIQKGEQVGGIAYKYINHLSFLLDGHHRAAAAMLEGIDFLCLTIDLFDRWHIEEDGKTMCVFANRRVLVGTKESIDANGEKLVTTSYRGEEDYYDISNLPSEFSFVKNGRLDDAVDEALFQRYMKRWSRTKQDFAWPAEYSQKASQYPTMKQLTEEAYQNKMESYDDI